MRSDPWQLTNLIDDPPAASAMSQLSTRVGYWA